MEATEPRRFSAAAERNKAPILAVLQRVLPARGRLLEIASGTGQHAVHGAAGLPGWQWRPSDPDPVARASIAALASDAALANLAPPLALDVLAEPWPADGGFDAVFCANLLHIAPWAACAALMRGAAAATGPDGRLLVYGPFFVRGAATSPGNLAFDDDLRARDPAWGLRWVDAVEAEARSAGWQLDETVPMPANNLTLVFGRSRA